MKKTLKTQLYQAIHESILDLRTEMKLPVGQDVNLAQLERKIWRKQKEILG